MSFIASLPRTSLRGRFICGIGRGDRPEAIFFSDLHVRLPEETYRVFAFAIATNAADAARVRLIAGTIDLS